MIQAYEGPDGKPMYLVQHMVNFVQNGLRMHGMLNGIRQWRYIVVPYPVDDNDVTKLGIMFDYFNRDTFGAQSFFFTR